MTTAPLQVLNQIKQRRITNRKRGLDTAWQNANEYISLKKGYPIMIAGVGGAGKTEFTFDLNTQRILDARMEVVDTIPRNRR